MIVWSGKERTATQKYRQALLDPSLRLFEVSFDRSTIVESSWSPDEPVTQVEAYAPIEPLAVQAEAVDLELALHSYERPLAVSLFGAPEVVPDWQDTHAMSLSRKCPRLGKWIRTDLGVRTKQGLGKNSPFREQVVRRITRDLHTHRLIESLDCEIRPRRRCLPGCGHATSYTRHRDLLPASRSTTRGLSTFVAYLVYSFPSSFGGGGGGARPFQKFDTSVRSIMDSKTLLSMQQFLEDAEKECAGDMSRT